jgi:hypothetical protein
VNVNSLYAEVKLAWDRTQGMLLGIVQGARLRKTLDENSGLTRWSIIKRLLRAEGLILVAIFGCVVLSLMLPMVALLEIVKKRADENREIPNN